MCVYVYITCIIHVQFSCSVVSDSLWPHESQHTRPPCPSPTPGVHPDSRPSSQWCHPAISSSVVPFSSCLQSFPASGSFPESQFFTSVGQSIGVSASASVLPINIQDWFPLGWTGWISLQSKGLSRAFLLQGVFLTQGLKLGHLQCRQMLRCFTIWATREALKEIWAPENWCFWTVVFEKTLESPLDCKEIQSVHPKRN